MNNLNDEARMIRAWNLAWRARCCPPDMVLAGELTVELQRHLEICPFCRREREAPFSEIQLDFPADLSVEKRLPFAGGIWSVNPTPGGWFRSEF